MTLPTKEEIAWAAGLFEGEGCFYQHRGRLIAEILMTDEDVMIRFRNIIGFGNVLRATPRPGSRKDIYRLRYEHHEWVQHLVCLLWPWLGSRRRQRAYEILRGYRVSGPMAPARLGYQAAPESFTEGGGLIVKVRLALVGPRQRRESPGRDARRVASQRAAEGRV